MSEAMALLAARAAIEDLVHGYAQLVRERRGGECGALFIEGGTFEVREAATFAAETFRVRSKVEGREAISAYVARSTNADARVCPLISNLIVRVNGNLATAASVMTRYAADGRPALGEYHDSFRNDDGVWRFSARIFTMIVAS